MLDHAYSLGASRAIKEAGARHALQYLGTVGAGAGLGAYAAPEGMAEYGALGGLMAAHAAGPARALTRRLARDIPVSSRDWAQIRSRSKVRGAVRRQDHDSLRKLIPGHMQDTAAMLPKDYSRRKALMAGAEALGTGGALYAASEGGRAAGESYSPVQYKLRDRLKDMVSA
jgi:hypothetical protein